MKTPEMILSDLIRIKTVNPPGNETAGAGYLKELFDRAGIGSRIIGPEEGRGSFIARIGSGTKKILFLSHMDVVPAGDDWDFDPFSGEIKNGFVYGRGALDCKDLMAAQAYAMLKLAKENTPLKGEVIFAATADEEAGGNMGAKYLLDNFPGMLQADFAINEGAEQSVRIKGKTVCFIQVGEKGTAWSRIKTRGKACHGSVPAMGKNAITRMTTVINALHDYRPEIKLIPEVKVLINELARLLGQAPVDQGFQGGSEGDLRGQVEKVLQGLELDKDFTEYLRAMTRMTISPNVIRGGSKTNIVPDCCEAELDIRTLPGQDKEYVRGELKKYIGENTELEFTMYREPTFSPSDCDYYRITADAIKEAAGGDSICLPHISTGSTDSKYLRSAGIPAYGIGLMHRDSDPALRTTVHGRNERTDVDSVRVKADFFTTLAKKYLS